MFASYRLLEPSLRAWCESFRLPRKLWRHRSNLPICSRKISSIVFWKMVAAFLVQKRVFEIHIFPRLKWCFYEGCVWTIWFSKIDIRTLNLCCLLKCAFLAQRTCAFDDWGVFSCWRPFLHKADGKSFGFAAKSTSVRFRLRPDMIWTHATHRRGIFHIGFLLFLYHKTCLLYWFTR